jgi:hypothetical protein
MAPSIGPGVGAGFNRWRRGGAAAPVTDAIVTAINADGWSVAATSPPTMEPATAPRFVSLSRQGFDASGAATTYPETLIMTQRVRQAFPNQASLDASRVALSDYVYSTDTVLGGQTNSSAETSPKPVARWALPDRATVGNALPLAIVAAHRNGRNREMVACVRYTATDGVNATVTQTVFQSSILGSPYDRNPVIGYAATLDITSLTEGQITANAEVFPWIGGAASVLNSADSAAGTRAFAPQIYRKAVARVAAPPLVYVSTTGVDATVLASGATGGGIVKVSTDPAVASANPFLTWNSALLALLAATTITGGIADGCEVRYMAGTHSVGAGTANTYTVISEVIVRADPAAAAGAVTLNLAANWSTRCLYMRFIGIAFARTTTAQITLAANARCTLEACTYANSAGGNAALLGGGGAGNPAVLSLLGTTITTGAVLLLSGVAAYEVRLVRGLDLDGVSTIDPFCSVGNALTNCTHNPGLAAHESGFVAFNRFRLQANGAVVFGNLGNVDGAAVIQNLIEFISTSTTSPAFRFSGDGNPGNVTHLVCAHNALTGFVAAGRCNLLYADTAGTNRTHKLCAFIGNIHGQINVKTDIFAATAANVNAWAYMYGVGCRGEVSQWIDQNSGGGGLGASHGSFQQAYPGLNASIGTSATVRNNPNWHDYEGTIDGSTPGVGGGAYTLQAGSLALARVANPVLRFDLYGGERNAMNDAAGCSSTGSMAARTVASLNLGPVFGLKHSAGLRRPTWRTIGFDALPTGWLWSQPNIGVTTTQNNPAPLEGWDLNGVPIVIRHRGATIRNCITGNNGTYSSTAGSHIRLGNSDGQDWSFFTLENLRMIGGGNETTDAPGVVAIYSTHTAPADFRFGIIRDVFIDGFRGDPIEINVAGDLLIERVYLGRCGWKPSAISDRVWPHVDWLSLGNRGNAAGPITIREIFIEAAQRPGIFGRTSYLARASVNTVNMTVDRIVAIGAGDWGTVPGDSEATANSAFNYPFGGGATAGNLSITNSALDKHPSRTWFHPLALQPNTWTGNLTWADGSAAVLP